MLDNHGRESESFAAASGSPRACISDDPLSQVLETIRLRSAVFFLFEPAWPYATGVPDGRWLAPLVLPGAERIISYHIVTEGPCWGCVADQQPVRLDSGDTLLLPHGDAYVIGSRPRPPGPEDEAPALEFFTNMASGALPPVVAMGEGSRRNRLICGFLGCDMYPFNPLLAMLPRLVRVPAVRGDGDALSRLIELAVLESKRKLEGGRCMLSRLSEVMFVELLRRYLRCAGVSGAGWLSGLRDPLVGAALCLLHGAPARSWTLDDLAQQVGCSRSTLAERFTQTLGEPPMHYLTRWRMQLAAHRLCEGAGKNYAVAKEVGYESEAAFSRAFKRVVGISPGQWKKSRGSIPSAAARQESAARGN